MIADSALGDLGLHLLDREHVESTNSHLRRHLNESGKYGVHWLPYDPGNLLQSPRVDLKTLELDFGTAGWQRWYIAIQPDKRVIGHLSLKGSRFDRGLHRCELGMGIEHQYWRLGLGSRLLRAAVEQARSVDRIDWLDLRVLSANGPAIALYRKSGFETVARIPDFTRIYGVPHDDILMSLWVGS